jgi:hypothetical protein
MAELSNFQKNFLAGSGHVEVFTQKEFDKALTLAQAEIMAVAIETTKHAIAIEREECAKLCDIQANDTDEGDSWTGCASYLANNIRARGDAIAKLGSIAKDTAEGV